MLALGSASDSTDISVKFLSISTRWVFGQSGLLDLNVFTAVHNVSALSS